MSNFCSICKIGFSVLLFLFHGLAYANISPIFSVYGSGDLNVVNGYMQVPAGGQPGSSTTDRPTFHELGIEKTSSLQVGFSYANDFFGVYGEYQRIRLNSQHTIKQDLISHNIFIPANTFITTHNKFDLYQLGINHNWYVYNNKLQISPKFELTVLQFSYVFSVPDQQSHRAFQALTARIGIHSHYFINKYFSVSADLASSIPGTSNLQVQTASIDINMNATKIKNLQTILFAGVGYERINFKDSQVLPNHLSLILSPMLQLGLKFTLS